MYTLARLNISIEMCQHILHQLLSVGRLVTFVCDEMRLGAGFVASMMKLFILLNSLQRLSHSEYVLHASVPMGSHLHTKLVVTHPQEELVYDHLLLSMVIHKSPR